LRSKINKLPLFPKTPKQAAQRSAKFIRWLRHHLFTNTSWTEAMDFLRRIYAVF
jgi:hypothetical protein